MNKYIPVVAHRGNACEHQENSIEGIRSAIELGAKFIEIDIQFSADMIPFVIHDTTLDRTHNISVDVLQTDSSLLKRLIPCLDTVIELIEEYPGVILFIEVKQESLRHHNNMRKLNEILAEYIGPNDSQFIVISFDDVFINAYLDMFPWFQAGWVLPEYTEASIKRLKMLNCAYAFIDYKIIPETEFMPDIATWVAYEVTERKLGLDLYHRGIDMIETMEVAYMLGEE